MRGRAGQALEALLRLRPRQARLVADPGSGGPGVLVPVEALGVDDVFLVGPGEQVPTDGLVLAGSSAVDESMLTGESVPAEKSPGDEVIGAAMNTCGQLTVRATAVGSETALAQMVALVDEAQASKAPIQRLADRIASVFVPVVAALALLTVGGWWLAGDPPLFSSLPLGSGRSVAACSDPGRPGFNEIHLSFIDAGGREMPVQKAIVMATSQDGHRTQLNVRRFGPGHFVADATLPGGAWTFRIESSTAGSPALTTVFVRQIGR